MFALLLQFLIGVDVWIGLVVPTEDGLWNDASESILNWFDVLSVRSGKAYRAVIRIITH